MLGSIDHENHSVKSAAVVRPCFACLVVATKIVGVEADVADCDFSLMRVQRGVCLCYAVRLQHVKHGGLACVVETQKHYICALLEKAEPLHCASEKVYYEHKYAPIFSINNLSQIIFLAKSLHGVLGFWGFGYWYHILNQSGIIGY